MRLGAAKSTFLRFLISGGTGFVIFYILALVIGSLTDLTEGAAAFLATLAAIPPTFLLQRSFTFRVEDRSAARFAGYLALQFASAIVIGVTAGALARAAVPLYIATFIAGGVGVGFSFAVQSMLVFRPRG